MLPIECVVEALSRLPLSALLMLGAPDRLGFARVELSELIEAELSEPIERALTGVGMVTDPPGLTTAPSAKRMR